MVYTIFDIDSANLVGAFATESAAWYVVSRSLESHGSAYIAAWVLEQEDGAGVITTLAEGDRLLSGARSRVTPRA